MRGPPVVLTDTLGRPVTNVISERGAVPMTVVNTLGEPVTLVASGGEPVTLFNENGTLWDYPFSLFANNEQGAWYDPSDYSTLYQDAAGTTPVTAVEQPVRLMLDRSKGLVLGPELVTNGDFSQGTTGWTDITGAWAVTSGTLTGTSVAANAYGPYSNGTSVVAGKFYQATYSINVTSGSLLVRVGNDQSSTYTTSGTYTRIFNAVSTGVTVFQVRASGSGFTGSIDNISVRELPGNHATAPNDASRPVLRARYNLLTYSEQFDNAGWTKSGTTTIANNAGVAPDGTTTADRLVVGSGSAIYRVQQNANLISGAVYTQTVYVKKSSYQYAFMYGGSTAIPAEDVILDLDTGLLTVNTNSRGSVTPLANGWYRFAYTFTATSTASDAVRIGFTDASNNVTVTGDAASGGLLWGAQLLSAADQSATGGVYQRIAAATDYDTSNPVWRPYLAFDGSDDSFGTSAIDFSGTDEMTVFAGVTKLSDAARGVVAELTALVSTPGSFLIDAPGITPATDHFRFVSSGSAVSTAKAGASYPAPTTRVVTGIGDIGGDVATLRINGTQAATSATDQGTGNYANAALFIGRRNNSSLPFNGRLYGLTVLGRTATAPELSAMEAWVAGKTGVTI